MIEMEIPKDIRKYEAKLIGPLTLRQTICLILGCVVAIPAYFLFDFLPQDMRYIIVAVLATPFILVGWVKISGMTFELYAKQIWYSVVAAPPERKYETRNTYSDKTRKNDKLKDKERQEKYKNRKTSNDFIEYE